MKPVIFGIDPKWNSLLPLVAVNIIMLGTVVIFALFVFRRRPGDPGRGDLLPAVGVSLRPLRS